MSLCLLADMGGTNIRFATLENDQITQVRRYDVARFEKIGDAIRAYYAEINHEAALYQSAACLLYTSPSPRDRG